MRKRRKKRAGIPIQINGHQKKLPPLRIALIRKPLQNDIKESSRNQRGILGQ
jgi:hypothetical protein